MKLIHFFKKEDPGIAAKIKAATSVSMDEAARERTRALLSEYVKMRPIRTTEPAPATHPLFTHGLSVFFMRHSMPAFAVVFVLILGGGTAAAAEGALPGDLLYPIKVHVSEEMRATLATSPKAKADWAVDRAERRLEEAATLALSGKLDDVTRAELDTNLDAHVKIAGENRRRLEDRNDVSDASEVRTNIDAVIIARENILDGRRTAKGVVRPEAATLMMSARAVSAEVGDDKINNGEEAETKGNRKAAKARIEAAKKFLGRLDVRLSPDARVQVETRLKEAAEAFSSGETDVSEGNKVEASSHFDSALESATKIEAIVSVSTDTDEPETADDNSNGANSGSGSSGNDGGITPLGL